MNHLDRAISLCGGVTGLANGLGLRQSVVSNWRARNSVPADRCIAVEALTEGRVTRYDLRPDVFGAKPVSTRAA